VGGQAGRAIVSASDDGALWSGRFSRPPAAEAAALGRSIGFDLRMLEQDVRASVAHVAALRDAGFLTADEARRLSETLVEVGEAIAGPGFAIDPRDEDVHSVVERAVTARLGDLGARLHAGRSRNDLVVTDLRLWLLDAGARVDTGTRELVRALVERAREHTDTLMPGVTHGRPAQVVTLGHHLCAHAWALSRDLERLAQWSSRSATSPLGAGALATSTIDLDARATAQRLGFVRVFVNSIDAVSDRDFVQEWVGVSAILATHLSRLAADLVRWCDPSLGWARMDDAYATGSSMMPQKRNPDPAELARAKAARFGGNFAALVALLEGLPLGYHRDLQEDKEPAFDAADTLELVLPALTGVIRTVSFDVEAMRDACDDEGIFATDLAEALVTAGVPFREAHRRVGELLRRLEDERRSLRDIRADEWSAFGLEHGAALLDPERSVAARSGPGGPSPASVKAQIDALDETINGGRGSEASS
jgi:argininosuccinate lyase